MGATVTFQSQLQGFAVRIDFLDFVSVQRRVYLSVLITSFWT